MAKRQEKQRFIRHYRDKMGDPAIDMHKVAEEWQRMGGAMPKPPTPLDLLAQQFAEAARDETKRSNKTGRRHRVYQAFPVTPQRDLFHYVDIDEATRKQMLNASVLRREQMVSDGVNLTDDTDHWNASNPDKEPIQLPMDLTFDIELRKAADAEAEEKAAEEAAAEEAAAAKKKAA